MVPEIWSTTDIVFCHCRPSFALYPLMDLENQNFEKMKNKTLKILSFYKCVSKMTVIWCMVPEIWNATDRIFLSIWIVFCPFTPLTTQKIKILKKMKKPPGDIIILHMCTINGNHMMFVSWDIKRDGQIFYHFGPFFCPFTTQKIKILKNWKKHL